MNNKRKLLVAFMSFIIGLEAWSCSCIGPDNFIDSVKDLIIKVEVMDVVSLDSTEYAYTATRLKVINVIKGQYKSDTLLILNDKGFECFRGLPEKNTGQQYIITGNLVNKWNSWDTV